MRQPAPSRGGETGGGLALAEKPAKPTVSVSLEAPFPGARVAVNRRLAGYGWVRAARRVRSIAVLLDGQPLGQAETGLMRGDLAGLHDLDVAARPGFRFDCRVPERPPGPAVLELLVQVDGAEPLRQAFPVELVATAEAEDASEVAEVEPLRLALEEARVSRTGLLQVRGWCVALRPLRSVEIRVGDRALGRAETGLPRDDVAEVLAEYPNAAVSGFLLRRVFAAGEISGELTATATDGAGLMRTDRLEIVDDPATAPPLLLTLEEAAIDETGVLRVRGWAVSQTPLGNVRVYLGDRRLGDAQTLLPRADVGHAHPDYPGASLGGFLLHMPLPGPQAAGQIVRAVASAAGGALREATIPLAVALPAAAAAVPAPTAAEDMRFFCDFATLTEDGMLAVKGWAICRSGVARVAVQLDNTDLGAAETGEERPDVATAFPGLPGAATSGFRFVGPVGRPCAGEQTLRLRVAGRGGERHEAVIPVRAEGHSTALDAAGEKQGGIRCFLDLPSVRDGRATETLRGFLSLSGWAFSAAGLAGIEVFVDGRSQGQAHRGIRREDLHNALGAKEALHAGFAMLIPPQVMKRGSHVVRIVISDRQGEVQEIAFAVESDPVLAGSGPWSLGRKLTDAEIDLQTRVLDACGYRPQVTLLLAGAGARKGLATTAASLAAQAWPHWTLAVPGTSLPEPLAPIADRVRLLPQDPATPLAALLPGDAPGLLAVIGPGDELGEDALLEFAVESALDRGADFLYADERRIDPADGEVRAFFKPDFAPDLLLSTNYIGRPWAATARLLARTGATLGDLAKHGEYDLVLRLCEQARAVRHVPKVLCARAARALDPPAAEKRALARALARRGIAGGIEPGCIAGTWRARRTPADGLVSVIIPTIAARGLIKVAIESIRRHTPPGRVQIIVLDNIRPDAPEEQRRWKDWFRAHADAVVATDETFNWSRFNNLGARFAEGEFLLFLNDDIEVLEDGWLDALMEHAGRPEVGAVGPLLLYPGGTVQHAGQFLAGSVGRHAFRFSPAEEPGPFGLARTQRNVISVTGACLLTRRDVFDRLGGFDEQHAIINNDLDYCLRLRAAGLAVIFTPHTRLTHHEMVSRAELSDAFDSARFRATWSDVFAAGDPYFSPHLAPDADDYVPEQEPLRARPVGHPLIAAGRVRRVLAVKLDHIGDFISAFPAFRRIRQHFPQAELTVLCAGASLSLAGLEPAIDRAIRFDFFDAVSEKGKRALRGRDFAELEAQLAPHRFDLALDLRRQPDTRAVLRHTGARWLAGFDRDNAASFLDISVPWEGDMARTHKRAHVSEALVAFVDAVAGACASGRALVAEAPPADAEAAARALPALAGHAFARPLVAIHAGAGAENKQWPAENFAALIDLMMAEADVDAVVIGGPDEAALAARIRESVREPARVLPLAGALALRDLPVLLRACALYVGNDSGPKHMAAALGVPTLGIHSGSVDATEWGPLGEAAVALRREMSCSPCYLQYARDCHRNLACLRGIRVGDVWRAARRLLALRAPPRAPAEVA